MIVASLRFSGRHSMRNGSSSRGSRSQLPSRRVLGAIALSVLGFACGSDSDEPREIDTAAPPATPGAGLEGDRPDPCRGVPLPVDQHYVASGLCASAVAFDEEGLRQITFTPNGDLIGVRTSGAVVRFRDVNSDGMFLGAGEIVEIANTGGNGNNAHYDEPSGYLYAGSPDGVVRFAYAAGVDDLDIVAEPEPVVIGQPSDGTHTYHTVHVYDGWLYVHSGSENNVVAPASPEYDTDRSLLKRFDLSQFSGEPFAWSDGEPFAVGLRNMVGYTRSPDGGLFGVVNGIDELEYGGEDVHIDNPGEPLVELEQGNGYGYPFCFTAQNIAGASGAVPPGTQLATQIEGFDNPRDDAWCAQSSTPPLTFLPAHTAPLDITFFEAGPAEALPAEWVGGAFVSLHGSWNTMPSVGHGVVHVPFGGEQPTMPNSAATPPAFPFSVVLGGGSSAGPVDGSWGWSSGEYGEETVRPVGVAVSPLDGALYISSDAGGVLYRVGVPL
jgi:glucose/arabinose dehydrogenase